ncbi:hypothetical protein [Streptomyces sp. NPDC055056]
MEASRVPATVRRRLDASTPRRPDARIANANSDAEEFGCAHAAFDAAVRAVAHLL